MAENDTTKPATTTSAVAVVAVVAAVADADGFSAAATTMLQLPLVQWCGRPLCRRTVKAPKL